MYNIAGLLSESILGSENGKKASCLNKWNVNNRTKLRFYYHKNFVFNI